MASTDLTDYERKRLANIRRNEQMMASLKSMASQLTASTKRRSEEAKPKSAPISKSGNETTLIVVRRSLRNKGMSASTEGLEDGISFDNRTKKPRIPTTIPKPPSTPPKLGPVSVKEAFQGEGSDRPLIKKLLEIGQESNRLGVGKFGNSYDVSSMTLKPDNIGHLVTDQIMAVRFFPCGNSRVIAAGNKHGDIGFWNLDHEKDEENGIYTYHSHSGPISGISIHPQSLSKVYSSCNKGTIRVMDAEKEVFDAIESSEHPIYSLSHRSSDMKYLFFGEGNGGLKIWDERDGKCSSQRILHTMGINSIDFNSNNPNLMATSSSDGTACIWDLRSIDANKPKNLHTVEHKRSLHSGYFSPSGKFFATTSSDDTVGILGGVNFEESSRIQHNNRTSGWIPPFKAIWGWDDSYIFIGNTKRGVDVISPIQKQTVLTLQSSDVTAIPCRFDIHPYHVGTLVGATGGGRVYVWTMS